MSSPQPDSGDTPAPAQNAGAAAFIDDLPPWQETFLANYSRNFKFGIAGGMLLCALAFWVFLGGGAAKIYKPKPHTTIYTADSGLNAETPDHKADGETGEGGGNAATSRYQYDGNALALNAYDDRSIKLTPAPDPAVTQDTADGSLPRVSEDGRQPWQVYARPFNTADQRPRIAFIVTDLGDARVPTDAAIARLPVNVTLSFDSQSAVSSAWCTRARQVGHEVILQIPMEPFDYPLSDPGPRTLLTTLPVSDNLQRLQSSLKQGVGYVGVTTLSGARFTTETNKILPMLQALHQRGLMFIDARVGPHSAVMDLAHDMKMPAVAVNVRIDQNFSPEAIDAAFSQLEQTARLTGSAIGMAPSVPIVIDRLDAWLKELPTRGIALAPVSAIRM